MGAGRPRLPKGEGRGSVITIRLTDAERDALTSELKETGLTVAKLARQRLFKQGEAAVIEPKKPEHTVTMSWESASVSLKVRNMDWPTWKTLLGVVTISEPDKS